MLRELEIDDVVATITFSGVSEFDTMETRVIIDTYDENSILWDIFQVIEKYYNTEWMIEKVDLGYKVIDLSMIQKMTLYNLIGEPEGEIRESLEWLLDNTDKFNNI